MIFEVHKKETEKLADWIAEHDEICRFADGRNQGAIGGRLTYCFTPTSIGTILNVSCACEASIDVTDYDVF